MAIVGAGVSIGASGEKIASWDGLLEDGIKRGASLHGSDDEWIKRKQADLKSGDLDEMLGVAELVTKKV